ncbi:site-specific recombinase, phage integrase family [Marvinbryantia formatexigens DSM 14469]|uniref:Site-specific recombinase, phage integrase family n=3 Tax=Marvinbryantia TaxID=248744 RepID=C6LCQ5_9FIRM|nr:site-specific recombinase, phage integrase family [Marvinbryantia formatexigens DSM 14469]
MLFAYNGWYTVLENREILKMKRKENEMEHVITEERLRMFEQSMRRDEKSDATVRKYLHDLLAFREYTGGGCPVTKEVVIAYKQYLMGRYAVASVNSMLAALNCFFKEYGWYDCVVKSLKVQRKSFRRSDRELTREEYYRLISTAWEKGNVRLSLIMQTICSTGIRVSELEFITVEALRSRRATVSLKGKTRVVLLPAELCRILRKYVKEHNISEGCIFVSRSGKPLDRSNIFHDMKALCETAGVNPEKVFPHNLRHLFAITYYDVEKDISHLADILGHASIDTTRIYTMVNGEEQAKQIDNLKLVI